MVSPLLAGARITRNAQSDLHAQIQNFMETMAEANNLLQTEQNAMNDMVNDMTAATTNQESLLELQAQLNQLERANRLSEKLLSGLDRFLDSTIEALAR